ncbi:MAG: hypothetical protein NXY57DRAFT_1041592 [Lentinula lateritia]|nr:MAG: hypothetical protein NXY57DRAFT_1041592 [Lentinula lateritia]
MSGRRRSTRLCATKGGGTDMMQNSTKTPSSPQKNPPKYNRKGSQATSPLRLRIPGKSTVQKAVESLLNSPPELELEESEPEIDQLESEDTGTGIPSVVKGRKRRKSRSITPPLIDKKAIRKAAKAEGRAIMLKARAKHLIQNRNQVPMEIKESTPAYSGESDIEISHGAIESEEEVDELDEEELPQVAKSHKTRKGKPKVKQQVEDEYSNGDEEEEDVAEYRKKQKHRNGDTVLQKLIFHLLIPAVNPEDPIERRSLDTQSSFKQFKNLVYKTLSCEKVHVKPSLSYKMPGATRGTSGISLRTEADWILCLEDIIRTHHSRPKSKHLMPLDVTLVVASKYLLALNARQNPRKSASSGTAGRTKGRGKKAQSPLPNLDGSDGAYDVGDDEENGDRLFTAKEKEYTEALMKTLKKCERCGPNIMCKVDIQGNHTKISYSMLRAWAISLTSEEHGVILKQPPKVAIFSRFFCTQIHTPALTETIHLPPPPPLTPQANVQYLPMPMPMYPSPWSHPALINQPQAWPEASGSHVPYTPPSRPSVQPAPNHQETASPSCITLSSDPPEVMISQYDTVQSFLTKLHAEAPQRGLNNFIVKFESDDYWNIDNVMRLKEHELVDSFGLSRGNAGFLLKAIESQMKAIEQKLKKRRLD